MCVNICVCVYVCIYVCTCVCARACSCVCSMYVHVCMYEHKPLRTLMVSLFPTVMTCMNSPFKSFTAFGVGESTAQPHEYTSPLSVCMHHTSYIIHHASYIIHHTSYIIHHTSCIIHHASYIHTSYIHTSIHHTSHIIHHTHTHTHTHTPVTAAEKFTPTAMHRTHLFNCECDPIRGTLIGSN